MPERRQWEYVDVKSVTLDGVILEHGEPYTLWQILHDCGKWTAEDANYCEQCGKLLDTPRSKSLSRRN